MNLTAWWLRLRNKLLESQPPSPQGRIRFATEEDLDRIGNLAQQEARQTNRIQIKQRKLL